MTNLNKEREDFQAAFPDLNFRRWEAGDYGPERMYWNSGVQAMWEGWLARAQASAPAWIAVSERLPEIDMSAPEYMRNVRVLGAAAAATTPRNRPERGAENERQEENRLLP